MNKTQANSGVGIIPKRQTWFNIKKKKVNEDSTSQ